jgi:CelD/BcsL family acetyltransferase involved in cellulose biosynthesis
MIMQIYRYDRIEDLTPYAEDWDRLAGGVPFRGWTWLSCWWKHYGPKDEAEAKTSLAVLGVFDASEMLVGIAPWYLDCSASRGRVLRQLGSGEVCSDYLSLLCQPGHEEAVAECVAEYLVENQRSEVPEALRWDLLKLDGIDAEDRPIGVLAEALGEAGCTIHRRESVNCWRLELPTYWETYVTSLGKNMRREVRRMEREIFEAGRSVLHTVEKVDDLPLAMNILVELHQRRREMLDEEGCFSSAPFLSFYHEVVPELLRHGQLQFHWLELDGKAVAAEYQLLGDGIVYAYQAGCDPEAMEHQPGKLLNVAILQKAIRGGYRAFDFLRGDEPYKARFGAKARGNVEIRAVPHRAVAQLRHGLWLAGSNVKAWVKRGG